MPFKDPARRQAYIREYHGSHRDADNARVKAWHDAHRDELKAYWATYNAERPGHTTPYARRARGFTDEYIEAKMLEQRGRCAICCDDITQKFYTDHDHETGRPRGLLCSRCNLGVGQFRDNPKSLRAAADYLEQYRAVH